jgi:hypothetical protein
VTFSFEGWAELRIEPTTVELPVIRPPAAPQKSGEKKP